MENSQALDKIPAPTADQSADQGPPVQQPESGQIKIDDSNALPRYANFCRISGSPEELIIDFGLNPQPVGVPTKPIEVKQRIVTGFYTAKRLMQVLQQTIVRHEAVFGVLETDVQKRISRQ